MDTKSLRDALSKAKYNAIRWSKNSAHATKGSKPLQVVVVIFVGMFCLTTYSMASSSGDELTPKQQYQKMLKSEKSKYYEYLEAINKNGTQLTPTQIKAIQAYKSEINQVENEQPNMTSYRQTVLYNVDQPPTVTIGKSRLSTITFVDSAGNAYPIQSFVVSDTSSFSVTQRNHGAGSNVALASSSSEQSNPVNYQSYLNPKQSAAKQAAPKIVKPKKSLPPSMFNSLTIKGNTSYANGDLIVYLVGKQTAIHIFLKSSPNKYDYQSNISVDGLTAQSLASVSSSGNVSGQPSHAMMEFLNGTPPKGAESLNITLENSQAWELGNYFYIRTRAELQSPAWLSRVATASGYKVFKITNDSHVVTMASHGMRVMAYINQALRIGDMS